MINYRRTNNIIGWVMFALSLLVYMLTLEPFVSFWDCGEFIASSYRLQITHPPGAPLYQMLGRVFSLLSFGNATAVAFWVNMLSAVASAFTVFFTYFITTRLAEKITNPVGIIPAKNQLVMVWAAGIIACLTLTFTDTFWFSAVEAEVYALSSFFTALVFWAALKWEENISARPRWLVFIAFATGLSIGVHLLNLLVIPAVVMVMYFAVYKYKFLNVVIAGTIGLGILIFIQFLIIPGIPLLAANTDRWFVNSLGLNIGTGVTAFFSALAVILVTALIITFKVRQAKIHMALLCLVFVLIGYSSYIMVPTRAAAHPPININAPGDAYSFVSYITREQYGQRPLFYGPNFNAKITEFKTGKPFWRPVNGKYQVTGYKDEYSFDAANCTIFPRMGDVYSGSSQTGYIGWTGVDASQPLTLADNLEFFFKYQFLHMYVRYHLWNFAGRQNDRHGHGNAIHGNGISGIGFFDGLVAAPENNLPDINAKNKARNHYYFLPLLLGLAGLFYHYSKKGTGFLSLFVLFLFTGFILCIYLNVPPFEPRERDYVFVGSFQVFCIWVGLGALWLMQKLHRHIPKGIWLGAIVSFLAAPVLLATQNWDDHDRSGRAFARDFARNYLTTLAPNAVLFVYGDNDTYPLWYLQSVEGFRPDVRIINANLMNSDWAAFELIEKKFNSAPLKLSISPQLYQNDKYELVRLEEASNALSLPLALELLKDTAPANTTKYSSGRIRMKLPCNKLFFNGITQKTKDWIAIEDTAYKTNRFEIGATSLYLYRAELLMLDIIANNFNERPVYFSSFSEAENLPQLNKYLRLEGLAYRLVPIQYPDSTGYFNRLNTKQVDTLLTGLNLTGYNNPKLYIDPEALYNANHYRTLFSHTIEKMLATGAIAKAGKLALLCQQQLPCNIIEYKKPEQGIVFLHALYLAGKTNEGDKLYTDFSKQIMQKVTYYTGLIGTIADFEGRNESRKNIETLEKLEKELILLNQKEKAAELHKFLSFYPKPVIN